jgi:hypothetical protein
MRTFRQYHRKIAPIVFLPLLATALTGILYRLGQSWFDIPGGIAELLMVIHQGEFLGEPLVPIYVLLLGLGLLVMILTGLTLMRRRSSQQKLNSRKLHQWLTPILFLPLAISAVTGILYRLGKSWFGLPDQQAAIFLRIHQGTYLGSFFRIIYVLLIGAGLIALLITGISMTGIFRRRRQA